MVIMRRDSRYLRGYAWRIALMYGVLWGIYAVWGIYGASAGRLLGGYVEEWWWVFTLQSAAIFVLWLFWQNVLAMMLLRMVSAVGYMGIRLGMGVEEPVGYVLSFAAAYFIFMVVEIIVLLYKLQR